LKRAPSKLTLENLNGPFLAEFLDHLEAERTNGPRTRNLRLAAIHSFFRYAALEAPQHAGLIQRVLAIPRKRHSQALVNFLTRPRNFGGYLLRRARRADFVCRIEPEHQGDRIHVPKSSLLREQQWRKAKAKIASFPRR